MSGDSEKRFRVKQSVYDKCVGKLLPHRIGQILKELGFRTKIFEVEENGVDIKVFDNDNRLILVGEIVNWSHRSYMNNSRISKIISNLSEYQCQRLFVYTAIGGENLLKNLNVYGISKLKIGYQLLPKYFHEHFAEKDQVILREIDSRITRKDIKAKIVEFLASSNIEITANIFTEAPVQTN